MDDTLERRSAWVVNQLYEDPNLTDELDDRLAKAFLGWAASLADALAERTDGKGEDAAQDALRADLRELRTLSKALGEWEDIHARTRLLETIRSVLGALPGYETPLLRNELDEDLDAAGLVAAWARLWEDG